MSKSIASVSKSVSVSASDRSDTSLKRDERGKRKRGRKVPKGKERLKTSSASESDASRAALELETLTDVLAELEKSVWQLGGDLAEMDSAVSEQMSSIVKSSAATMKWTAEHCQSIAVVAQKCRDHSQMFVEECTALDRKCERLNQFEQFLTDLKRKLTLLENEVEQVLEA